MRPLYFRYLIYIIIFWSLFKYYHRLNWHEKRKKYVQLLAKHSDKNVKRPNNSDKGDSKGIKTILFATSVYGMDNWGIGFGTGPFKLQGNLNTI